MGKDYDVQIASYRNSHSESIRNINYSIRNMVTSTVITSYGVRWILVLSG